MLSAIELIPHPESEVRPLNLEELIASLYSAKQPISFEIAYLDKYIRLYIVGPKDTLENLKKSLKTIYGKIIVEDSRPPSLKGMLATAECLEYDERKKRYRVSKQCSWYVAELRLSKPLWHVLVKHSEKRPIENNPVDVVLASMKPRSYIQIIFFPEPRARQMIADWVYEKTSGKSTSIAKQIINDLVDIFSPSTLSDNPYPYYERERMYYQYHWKQFMLDLEKDQIKQAQLKMASPLFSVRIRIYADDPEKVNEIASSFNQFSGNSFMWKIRRVKDEDLEIAEERRPLKLGLIFKDKKMPILSARELALFVNIPTPVSSLPLRTGYVALEPPPELKDLGLIGKNELSVEDLDEFARKGVVLLGFFGDRGFGINIDEFRKSHKAIFGTTGAGKSSFARYLMLSILKAYGCGNVSIIYIDPNGDDAIKLLKLLPEECVDHVVYIDPRTARFFDRVVKINFLEYGDEYERKYLIEAFLGAVASYFGRFWGPRTEHLIRMALLLITSAPPGTYSLTDLYRVFEDDALRARFLEYVDDEKVATFWTHDFPALMKSRSGAEAIQSVKNKLGKFVNDPLIRPLVDARKSTIDFRKVLDEGRIVIVNLGALKGTDSLVFLGAMLLSRILVAAFARGMSGEGSRKPAFLFIDELHNFVSPMLAKLLAQMMAEIRKFNLFIVAMTQYPKQLPKELRSALYELARHIFVFQVGLDSAKELKKVFDPYLGESDLMNIDPYHYAARLKLGTKTLRPFTLKAPYIPVELEGSNIYTDDPVVSKRIARSLELYGAEVVESKLVKLGIEIRYSPATYTIAYELHRLGGRVSIAQLVEAMKSLGIAKEFFESVEKLKSVAEEGAIVVEGDRVTLSQEAKRLFEIEFSESKHVGGELHRRIVKEIAEDLMSRNFYVWVDTRGSEEVPDIIAIPASKDLSEWLYDQAMCIEVEADPVKHTTFEKLVQILRRCYRAGCSSIKIVVPSEEGKRIVEDRLREVLAKRKNIAAGMGIALEWLDSVSISIEVYRPRAEEVSPKPEARDARSIFLEWLAKNLGKLLEAKSIAIDDSYVYITRPALEEFEKSCNVKVGSLRKLAELLNAREVRISVGRERPRAVAIPRELVDVHRPQKQLGDHRTVTNSTGTNNEKE